MGEPQITRLKKAAVRAQRQATLSFIILCFALSPQFASTHVIGVGALPPASDPSKVLLEVEAHGVEHLALNHWLGTKAYAFPSVLVNQKLALPGDLQTSMRFCSESVESVMIEIAVVPHLLNPAPTTAAAVSSLVVRASVHAYSHFAKSGMGLTLSVPHQTHAALQLLSQLWHPFWSLPDPHQQLAAVDRPQLLDVYHSAHPGLQGLLILSVQCSAMLTNLPGDLRFGTSHVPTMVLSTAVVLQPLPAWSDIVADDSYEEGMCLIQEKPFTNETVGLLPYGSEATPSAPAQTADGVTGDTRAEVNKALTEAILTTAEGNDTHQTYVSPMQTFIVLQELACVVLEIYKEAGAMACHSLTSYLHVTYTRCATTLAEAIPILKFLWKELCGECRHAIRAGTGDYTIVVMGCEMVVMMLVASVAWMIRRLLLLEKQLTSSRRNSNMRHNSSHKTHCSSKRIIMLENTTEKLKHGVNFAHRLLGKHHVRTGRRHKALKGSLSLLKRQHVRARRQRLALKKQLRRAVAQQTLLERQVGRSLRSGSSAQAADLVNLRNSCLEQQTLMGADVSALNQKVAHLETQLRTEQRTQDLLESQAVLIAELRSQLSAGQERQEGLIAKVACLEQAQAALQADAAAGAASCFVNVPLSGQVSGTSNGVGGGVVELDDNGSVVVGGEEQGPSPLQGIIGGASSEELDSLQALRAISQVETGRIGAVKAPHHDYRGDYGMEEVERSPPSYLSTTTTAPSLKPPSLMAPPSNTGSFSMAAGKACRFQQHEEVFSRINSGMDLGSSKGRRGPHTGNPFAAGLTPATSQTLPSGIELSAVSAATSSAPLLRQAGDEAQGRQRAPIQRGDSMLKKGKLLLKKIIPRKSRRN